jgi:RimJ/RimL family protein N-acetyltransferase
MIDSPGLNVRLRLVDIADAAFILRLRLSPRGRYLSPVDDDLQKQQDWIRAYKLREAAGDEHYFIINHRAAGDVGTIRVYDLDPPAFYWGSWILNEDAPRTSALESVLVLHEWCFYRLNFIRARCVVRKNNQASLDFNRRLGARIIGEDEQNVFFEMTRDEYAHTRQQLESRGVISSPGISTSKA